MSTLTSQHNCGVFSPLTAVNQRQSQKHGLKWVFLAFQTKPREAGYSSLFSCGYEKSFTFKNIA